VCGELLHVVRLVLLCSRFEYEYTGGHIRNAQLIQTCDVLSNFFDDTRARYDSNTTIIVHCEFSTKRAPYA
jgi:rhodanese-related sulfurtransferase